MVEAAKKIFIGKTCATTITKSPKKNKIQLKTFILNDFHREKRFAGFKGQRSKSNQFILLFVNSDKIIKT